MPGLKKPSYACILFFAAALFFVSCGADSTVKTPAGSKNRHTSDQTKIIALESELSHIKQDQENLKQDIQEKKTRIQSLQDTITSLEKKVSALEQVLQSEPVSTPSTRYQKARNLFLEENYTNAASIFMQFQKKYPRHNLADNSVYWLGECHYSVADYENAIRVFKRLVTTYPQSEKVPDALLKTGYSYLLLEDANRAHHFLKQVLIKHPFSSAAEKAQEKLIGLK